MKILATHISSATQIHTGKCYFLGMVGKYDTQAYNIEVSGSAASANTVGKYEAGSGGYILPKPGVECTNGLYLTADGWCTVYWSLG